MLTPTLTVLYDELRRQTRERELRPFERALHEELKLLDADPDFNSVIGAINTRMPPGPVPNPGQCPCCGKSN
jgi:hypothetical protein